jgi:hypothetical protein
LNKQNTVVVKMLVLKNIAKGGSDPFVLAVLTMAGSHREELAYATVLQRTRVKDRNPPLTGEEIVIRRRQIRAVLYK